MKRIITMCSVIFMSVVIFAQAPNKMSYQAIIRNNLNALVTSSEIGMRISVLQTLPTGKAVYIETQKPVTNTNGLASIEIGGGSVVLGEFSNIDWVNGPYFVKIETDPTGGTNYSITNTSQLLSVPYALYAEKSSNPNVFSYGIPNTTTLPQGSTKKLTCSLNYICGEYDNISFLNSTLPEGVTISHSNIKNTVPFIDTLILSAANNSIPGNYPISFTAISSKGTKSTQFFDLNIVASKINFQGNYTHYDSLYLITNYSPFAYNGPFNSVVSPVVSNQFTISNFGQNGVTITAVVNTSNYNSVTFTIPSQVVGGCTYSGEGGFNLSGTIIVPFVRYTKVCSGTQYRGYWRL